MFKWLGATMEQPPAFGAFHLIFLAAIVVVTVLITVFFRKSKDKTFRIVIAIIWGILVLFEIGKQIVWNYDWANNKWASTYNWSSFPYQFCSLPFYLYPLVAFLPESKVRTGLNLFVATFVFFGGFGYLFAFASACQYVFINVQTMVHHGLMVTAGILIFVHEYDKFNYKTLLQSSMFLVFSVALAIVLNLCLNNLGYINLFELNPLRPTEAAVFGDIIKAVGYPLYLLIYLVGFFAFANAVYWAEKGIMELVRYIGRKRKAA